MFLIIINDTRFSQYIWVGTYTIRKQANVTMGMCCCTSSSVQWLLAYTNNEISRRPQQNNMSLYIVSKSA